MSFKEEWPYSTLIPDAEWVKLDRKHKFPTAGGSYFTISQNDKRILYWNPDSRTWHPTNGFRKNIGFPENFVQWYLKINRLPI